MEVNGDVSIEQSEQLLDLPDCLDTSSDVKSSWHLLGYSTTMFYLVLPSNSSFDFYPDNTVANYTIRLPRDIELSGDWEVGLEEIQYSHNWFSIQPSDAVVFAYSLGSESSDGGENDEWHYRKLDPGYYANKGEIVDAMGKELKRSGVVGEWDISWDAKNDVVCLNIPANMKFMMDKDLNPLLGFSEKSGLLSLHSSTKSYSTSKGTLNQHLSALYVYCNIVKPRVVGDSMAGNGLDVYGGVSSQKGHGLGSIFGGLFRGAMPILKNVGKAVGKQILNSGLAVANDVAYRARV
ncbi:hypothetical protein CAPTEDRAFT_198373 [Capitella teleta]|uniref:Uncharacterized protein n=1 Tax=Capitella teleta TaxID=283909 RepID=R7T946_CAPTE|nr:hypothetical protein CAPTEDRAFT_198373 [Capitella teleta]|eukprot:ELT89958.1 hypothetical protein CAPTEDRAFT_198373 [Capitella teleta]